MRACCTAESCRASNSESVTTSPFTRAMTRSTISARSPVAAAARLASRRKGFDGFMVHLGPGPHGPDELADREVRFFPFQLRAGLGPTFVFRRHPRRPAVVHAQH